MAPGDELGATLEPIDVPYRERRLMFILAGIAELYSPTDDQGHPRPGPPRADLDTLKATAWGLLDDLRKSPADVMTQLTDSTVGFLKLRSPSSSGGSRRDDPILADPADFAAAHTDDFQALFTEYSAKMKTRIGDGGDDLWAAFTANTANWSDDDKQVLLSRYLGFPLWDGMIFPDAVADARCRN